MCDPMTIRHLPHSNIENRNRSTSFNFTGDLNVIAAADYFHLEESANDGKEELLAVIFTNTKTNARVIFTKTNTSRVI